MTHIDTYGRIAPSGINSCNDPSWLHFTIKCPPMEDRDQEVYEDLCYVTFSSSLPEVLYKNPPFSARFIILIK